MAETLRRSALLVLILVALPQVACFTTSPRMHGLAADLQEDVPELELDHQFGLTMGRMSLGMVKGIAKWGMDEDDRASFRALRGVKKVELATYDTYGEGELRFPRRFEASLDRRGWETLARFRDGGELGWIVYRMDGQRLKNMLVVVHDGYSLTLVRLGGRLDRVVSAALAFSREEVLDDDWHDAEEWEEETDWTDDERTEDEWSDESLEALASDLGLL